MIEVKKFFGEWCGPCKALAPLITKLKEQHGDVTFTDYDVDKDFEQASKYNVRSIPLVVIEHNGNEIHRFSGLQSEMAYNNAINEVKQKA
jgi:thioredoxin 1|tara:strand:+ start:375 stop:644 length:270 start_codon:yes stop_codon:yes gene_type:complete